MSNSDRLPPSPAVALEARRTPVSLGAVFCFSIELEPEPGAMARVLEQFAKRALIPTRWHSDIVEPDLMQIDIQMSGVSADLVADIARGVGAIVGVQQVLTSRKVGAVPGEIPSRVMYGPRDRAAAAADTGRSRFA